MGRNIEAGRQKGPHECFWRGNVLNLIWANVRPAWTTGMTRKVPSAPEVRIRQGVIMTRLPGDTGSTIMLSVAPHDIDFFNKLLEGYDNLAMVTTIDAHLGHMVLRVAENAKKDIMAILHCLPIPVSIEQA